MTTGFTRGRAVTLVLDATSPPYNWCDRRCERCPLAGRCAMLPSMHDDEHDENDERGDEGLESAGDAVLFGLGELLDTRERCGAVEPFDGLVAATAFVIARTRRLAIEAPSALHASGAASLDWDTSAGVVILDRSVAALRRTVETLRPREAAVALAAALAALAPEVARWNAQVPDAFRIALGARIREGTAPSPFCTTDH